MDSFCKILYRIFFVTNPADILDSISEVVVKSLISDEIPDFYGTPFIILGSIGLVLHGHSRSFRVVKS
jgi:hypothetical protein